jgi:hypothetical protein
MLLTEDIDTLVIHINLKGKKNHENEDFVWVKSSWENWHEFVLWTIDQNFGGLENMSHSWKCWLCAVKTYSMVLKSKMYFILRRSF